MVLSIDQDRTVCPPLDTFEKFGKAYDLAFANGGDKVENLSVCEELGITLIDGFIKNQSSSWLLEKES